MFFGAYVFPQNKKEKAMGIIQCNIHGRQGFWEMCVHIWGELKNNRYPNMEKLPGYPVKICKECFEQNNVGRIWIHSI